MINSLSRNECGYEREFFSLSKRKVFKFPLPEAMGVEIRKGTKGWLVMNRSSYDMSLLHPITHVQIRLPTCPKPFNSVRSVVLSASPLETADYVVMIAGGAMEMNAQNYMAFWKPGDATWTQVKVPESSYWIDHLCYYNGKFYAFASPSHILMYDVFDPIWPNPSN